MDISFTIFQKVFNEETKKFPAPLVEKESPCHTYNKQVVQEVLEVLICKVYGATEREW